MAFYVISYSIYIFNYNYVAILNVNSVNKPPFNGILTTTLASAYPVNISSFVCVLYIVAFGKSCFSFSIVSDNSVIFTVKFSKEALSELLLSSPFSSSSV